MVPNKTEVQPGCAGTARGAVKTALSNREATSLRWLLTFKW